MVCEAQVARFLIKPSHMGSNPVTLTLITFKNTKMLQAIGTYMVLFLLSLVLYIVLRMVFFFKEEYNESLVIAMFISGLLTIVFSTLTFIWIVYYIIH